MLVTRSCVGITAGCKAKNCAYEPSGIFHEARTSNAVSFQVCHTHNYASEGENEDCLSAVFLEMGSS
jgi:hypothetical protein